LVGSSASAAKRLDEATARAITGAAVTLGKNCDHVYQGPLCPVNNECHESGYMNWGKDVFLDTYVCIDIGTTCTYPIRMPPCVWHQSYDGDNSCSPDQRYKDGDHPEFWHGSCK